MDPQFFTHFGLYVTRGFLSADTCQRLVAEMGASGSKPATIREGGRDAIDADYRRTHVAAVSDDSVALLRERILALKPALERHFGVTTTGCQRPKFLTYRQGDFFALHSDSIPRQGDESDALVTDRRISVVVFLNGESDHPRDGSYQGGSLDFYNLMDDPRIRRRPFPLTGEEGLLVAFRPEIPHAVSPVTGGQRCTVVTWFEGGG